jgi:hypothetical protein
MPMMDKPFYFFGDKHLFFDKSFLAPGGWGSEVEK